MCGRSASAGAAASNSTRRGPRTRSGDYRAGADALDEAYRETLVPDGDGEALVCRAAIAGNRAGLAATLGGFDDALDRGGAVMVTARPTVQLTLVDAGHLYLYLYLSWRREHEPDAQRVLVLARDEVRGPLDELAAALPSPLAGESGEQALARSLGHGPLVDRDDTGRRSRTGVVKYRPGMSYSSPDPRWTRLDQARPAPVVSREVPSAGQAGGGGPILPLLRPAVTGEPVDHEELLNHVATAIHDVEPVFDPRPELLALLDLPDVTEPNLDRDAALARVEELRDAPEEHAELIGAVALAVSASSAVATAAPSHDLAPSAIGMVCTALHAEPPVRSAKEAYQHARAARNTLTTELPAFTSTVLGAATLRDTALEEPAARVLLRLYVLRRWLLETTWPQRRACWRVLDKVTAATYPPADPVTLTHLTERLDEYQFRRWPS